MAQSNLLLVGEQQRAIDQTKPILNNCYIAVIDTETTLNDKVMSIGVVIADAKSYKLLDKGYYLIDPEYKEKAFYSYALHQQGIEERILDRSQAIHNIKKFLKQYEVSSVFAYNAYFDKNHLPELSYLNWYDIIRVAAYRQHNEKIPMDAPCYKTGRLKDRYKVDDMFALLSGNQNYSEKHNALTDAIDELKIMQLLNHPIQKYQIAFCKDKEHQNSNNSNAMSTQNKKHDRAWWRRLKRNY